MRVTKAVQLYIMVMFLFSGSSVFAQDSKEDVFEKISQNHNAINKSYDNINSGKSTNFKQYAGELDSLFNNLQQQYALLQKKQNPKEKELVKQNQESITKSYGNASKYLEDLKAEAKKDNPDKNKIKKLSKLLISQVQAADNQQKETKKKLINK